MKKILILISLSLLLTACSSNAEGNNTSLTAGMAEGETKNTDDGQVTSIRQPFPVNQTQEIGGMKVTVEEVEILQVQPKGSRTEMFGGNDIGIVAIRVAVENLSDNRNTLYPEHGSIVTSNGIEDNADSMFSESMGGNFEGHSQSQGEVWFMLETDASQIDSFVYSIPIPRGGQFDFEIQVNDL